jgi:hypothetical protein
MCLSFSLTARLPPTFQTILLYYISPCACFIISQLSALPTARLYIIDTSSPKYLLYKVYWVYQSIVDARQLSTSARKRNVKSERNPIRSFELFHLLHFPSFKNICFLFVFCFFFRIERNGLQAAGSHQPSEIITPAFRWQPDEHFVFHIDVTSYNN